MGHPADQRNRERLQGVERRKQICDMIAGGMTQAAVARELGISRHRVGQLFRQALARAENEAVAQYRAVQIEKLERLGAKLDEVIESVHVAHSQGRVVRPQIWNEDSKKWVDDPDAAPYKDSAPTIAAINAYRGLLERGAKLLGADAPTRTEVAAVVEVTINGINPQEVI